MKDRQAFLRDRKQGLGGSDVAAVFSLEPYGCATRLWYDKRDVGPDHEEEENPVLELGTFLEPLIVSKFQREFPDYKIILEDESRSSKDYPFMRANVDGIIEAPGRGRGILEAKTAGRDVFYKMRKEGLPQGYVLQLQQYLYVYDCQWGAFAIMNRESGQYESFEVERDDALIAMIIEAEEKFWKSVENGPMPDRLDPSDKRCKTCNFRRQCQGDYILQSIEEEGCDIPDLSNDQEFAQAAKDYIDAKEILADAELIKKAAEDTMKELIGNKPLVMGAGLKIHYKPQTRVAWDTTKLGKEHPELVEQYKVKTSISRPFRVFQI